MSQRVLLNTYSYIGGVILGLSKCHAKSLIPKWKWKYVFVSIRISLRLDLVYDPVLY